MSEGFAPVRLGVIHLRFGSADARIVLDDSAMELREGDEIGLSPNPTGGFSPSFRPGRVVLLAAVRDDGGFQVFAESAWQTIIPAALSLDVAWVTRPRDWVKPWTKAETLARARKIVETAMFAPTPLLDALPKDTAFEAAETERLSAKWLPKPDEITALHSLERDASMAPRTLFGIARTDGDKGEQVKVLAPAWDGEPEARHAMELADRLQAAEDDNRRLKAEMFDMTRELEQLRRKVGR